MGGFLAGLKPAKNQAVQHSAFAPASALVAALLACVGRLRRASQPCRRQGGARKRTVKSESLRKQTLEMPQCGMIHPCRRQGRARKRTLKSESLRKQTLEMPQCGMIHPCCYSGIRQGKRIIVVGEHKAGIFRFVSKVSACCQLSDSSF